MHEKKTTFRKVVHLACVFSIIPLSGFGGSFCAILFETDGCEHNGLNRLMAQNRRGETGPGIRWWGALMDKTIPSPPLPFHRSQWARRAGRGVKQDSEDTEREGGGRMEGKRDTGGSVCVSWVGRGVE